MSRPTDVCRRPRRRRSSNIVLLLGVLVAACGGADVAQPPPTTDTSVTATSVGTTSTAASTPTTGIGPTTTAGPRPSTTTPARSTTTARRPTTTAKEGGGWLGAPFDIPAIVDTQGFSRAEAREAAEGAFNRECGIDPCRVTFVDVDPEPKGVDCPIVFSGRTDPKAGTRVRRGSVVKLIFMYLNSCSPA